MYQHFYKVKKTKSDWNCDSPLGAALQVTYISQVSADYMAWLLKAGGPVYSVHLIKAEHRYVQGNEILIIYVQQCTVKYGH